MAMLTQPEALGVDVAKDWLDFFDGKELTRIDNKAQDIRRFLKHQSKDKPIAIEATNDYHELFIEISLSAGYTVYLVDAYRLFRYRDAVGVRAKTDALDAQLLHRYLCAEKAYLIPYKPAPKAVKRLLKLLGARAKLVKSKVSLRQALSSIAELEPTKKSLMTRFDQAIKVIENKLKSILEDAGYDQQFRRIGKIAGIGPLTATALTALFHRGEFRHADAFIAFMGMDVRVRESGRFKGRRKLTKKGNPEIRRLLFNAGRAGAKTSHWKDYYESLLARGLSKTAAVIAVARKIAKLAFVIMRDQSEFREKVA